jgi:GNAT superfamily N-acetyltransferase
MAASSLPPNYSLHEGYPPVQTYLHLRHASGLSERSVSQAVAALQGSWYGCYITHQTAQNEEGEIAAMARVIGDGGWYFVIADVAVLPTHQRRGLGDILLKNLIQKIRSLAPPPSGDGTRFLPYVSLLADEAGRRLYEKNGFVFSAPRSLGMVLEWSAIEG